MTVTLTHPLASVTVSVQSPLLLNAGDVEYGAVPPITDTETDGEFSAHVEAILEPVTEIGPGCEIFPVAVDEQPLLSVTVKTY